MLIKSISWCLKTVSVNIFTTKINNCIIVGVYTTNLLGVVIDCDINKKEQIKRVNSEVAKSLAITYNLRKLLTTCSMKIPYNPLGFFYINYC